ncbi:Protocatechuate 3,4-dioxygenase beta chain [Rubripirellula amarantea]|uniref:Protocatechuate 3,4-dioxygenase beta chain n=1 Tax=Rubripirellula amarantea TaxID=2527999 RepID=A0A5C5WL65_9BACT|nr:protocatechuate 3,4-dioxygenase [Rubripirellula amarantea]TWT50811.1 Protocatechuate 3,4-dioxygenase beta chain [Rubripirellula amarantea]
MNTDPRLDFNRGRFPDRRQFLNRLGGVSLALSVPAFFERPGLFADELMRTPRQTEGPFYPVDLPLDTDNDLLIVNDAITPAVGEIVHLSGRVLDTSGAPVRNALVEIWQVDNQGVYLHKGSNDFEKLDRNFQSFGRFLTGSTGEYYFRTIKPVPYPGRTPHIHFAVKKNGKKILTTQCYIKGYEGNERDGIWNRVPQGVARDSVTIGFTPIPDSTIGELAANFRIVLGSTPEG